MKKYNYIIIAVFVGSLFLGFVPKGAGAQMSVPPLQTYLRQGIEKAMNLDFQSAIGYFQKGVQLDREDPLPSAFLSLTYLFACEMVFADRERLSNQDSMLRYGDETLAKGQKRIERNPQDARAHFAMGLASFVKVRWAVRQKSYLTVAHEAVNAWNYMQKARETNPQDYDVLLPIGMFHYHIDHLAGLTRFLSSLFITSGDHRLGLQEVELAAEKGDLLKELAAAELSGILITYEKRPAKALPLILKLREEFPQNYNFSFGLANIYSELHRFDEAFAIAAELEKGIQSGKAPLVPQLQPRYENLTGKIFFNQGNYFQAEECFQKVLKDTSRYNSYNRASAFLYLGMIHDLSKERKKAEEYYSQVLKMEGGQGNSLTLAKKYLKDPFVLRAQDKPGEESRR